METEYSRRICHGWLFTATITTRVANHGNGGMPWLDSEMKVGLKASPFSPLLLSREEPASRDVLFLFTIVST